MSDDRDPKLDTVLSDLQSRFGSRIIAPAKATDMAHLPTGNATLDEQMGWWAGAAQIDANRWAAD